MNDFTRTSKFHYFFLFVLLIPCWIIGSKYFVDLKTIYKVAQLAGDNPMGVYQDFTGEAGRFFYGPIFIWLVRPMAFVPIRWANYVWLIPQTMSYVIFWVSLSQLMPKLFSSTIKGWWLLLFAFSINPIHNNFQSNNIQLILCAMLVLAELLMQRTSSTAKLVAAGLVSLASTIKIFPIFIWLFYFVSKTPKVKLFLVFTLILFMAFPIFVVGGHNSLEMYQGLLANISTYQKDNSLIEVVDILCLPSLVARIGHGLNISETTYALATKLITIILSSIFLVSAYKTRNLNRERQTQLWALGLALMAFLNPSTRVHYFIFYVPAFCSLLENGLKSTKPINKLTVLAFLSFVFLALTTEGVVGKNLNNLLESLSVPTLGVFFLLAGMIFTIRPKNSSYREPL